MWYNIDRKKMRRNNTMRLSKSVSKNAISYYVIESIRVQDKNSTRTVEKLGTHKELLKEHEDPEAWAKEYVESLNKKLEEERKKQEAGEEILIKLNSNKQIQRDTRYLFDGGYLFIQKLFYQFGLGNICNKCQEGTNTKYDLSEILSKMVCNRILNPGSVAHSYEMSKKMIEKPKFELHDMYRALSLIAKNGDYIQEQLYKNTKKISKRKDKILYYDCSNYYFEIEEEDNFRKYGHSKENRPNPIVGMGLMMDEEGIPLAFSVFPGNENEQITLTPLEEKIEQDFNHSKFIICTDAGLSSASNKLFNSKESRAFISTQSIKKMSSDMQEWCIDKKGWKIVGDKSETTYSLDDIEKMEEESLKNNNSHSIYYDKLFYKQKNDIIEIEKSKGKENDYVEQTIFVTFSLKYKSYLRSIRNGQIERAIKKMNVSLDNAQATKNISLKYGKNDYKRFIDSVSFTDSGEVAEHTTFFLKDSLIDYEEKYDGFYALSSNLDEPIDILLGINKKRWEIEECFRITKDVFETRPVFLSREDRIKAHFLISFLSLVLYRFLEKSLCSNSQHFTTDQIISQLRDMSFRIHPGSGFEPCYVRTDFTDRLHQIFGFRTDFEIISLKSMKNIVQISKSF